MTARDLPPATWTTGTTEVFHTGTWRAKLPRHIKAASPCQAACPVNGDIAEWIGRARAGDLREAFDILTRHNPFPAISGRVCHHPCETACNRAGYDAPLAICRLERHVGDTALANGWRFTPPTQQRAARIGVVGGGPSGLAAAFHLAREGYRVTLFEARAQLGGVMRYGIPAYRLPRAVLDGEIARIVALGVEVRCNAAIETPGAFAKLRREFDAMYVAVGAGVPRRLPLLDYAAPWVADGAAWLAAANAGTPLPLGHRLCVIGGGSAAIDVARSARRAGHSVTLLALEAADALPAQRAEVTQALEEGVGLESGAMLAAATCARDAIELACVRVAPRPDARGAFDRLPGTDFTLAVDGVVVAIGQDPDLAAFGALMARAGLVGVDARQATSAAQVYAGGDATSMARFVTEAFGMGKRAAIAIHQDLSGAATLAALAPDPAAPAQRVSHVVPLASIATAYHPLAARASLPQLAPEARLAGAAVEVEQDFDPAVALAEGARCFSCGTCIECDNCVTYCPDLAIRREGAGYVVLADYCKGCGLCVRECPTGSMDMIEESR
jgi:NADPH-dependent glutamate synthase beta subunit-like oxidoreductase/ferredoxin